MTIDFDDDEVEDLMQLIYAKITELDADPETLIDNSRKKNRVERLNAIYTKIGDRRYT